MHYVRRDDESRILAVSTEPMPGASAEPTLDRQALREFLERGGDASARSSLMYLEESDLEVVRVLDDLIDVLVQKGVIRFTDLPLLAQRKLVTRRQAREDLHCNFCTLIDGAGIL